jgi:hypothetical protein
MMILNGTLRPAEDAETFVLVDRGATDMEVSARRIVSASSDGWVGVAGRMDAAGTTGYAAHYDYGPPGPLMPNGVSTVTLYKLGPTKAVLAKAPVPHGVWKTLSMKFVGSTITASTDTTKVLQAADATYAGTRAGAYFAAPFGHTSTNEGIDDVTIW